MSHRFKSLGLALLVAGALTTSAQASEFTSPGNAKVFLTAEQFNAGAPHQQHTFTTGIRSFVCGSVILEGENAAPAKSVTLTPTYSSCSVEVVNWVATVTHNGCNYKFNQPVAGGGGTFNGSVNLECSGAKVIEIHSYTSAANHSSGTSVYTVTLEPFTNKGNNVYTNNSPGAGEVAITTTVEGIPKKIHGSALLCGTQTEGTTTGAFRLRGYKNAAHTEPTAVSVS